MNQVCKAVSIVNLFFAAPAVFLLVSFMVQESQIGFLFSPLSLSFNLPFELRVPYGHFKSVGALPR